MNYQSVQYFLEIVQCGNLTKAADRLYMSTPSLSKYIKAFEAELGFSLFTRSNRGMELTEEGRTLYETVSRPFFDFTVAFNQATSKSRNQRETIIMAVGEGESVDRRLMDVLIQFNRRYRDQADLVIRHVFPHDLGSGLSTGDYNISILSEQHAGNHARFSFIPLYDTEIQILLPRNHPLADLDEVDLDDFKDEKFIVCVSEREHYFSDMVSKVYHFTPNCVYVESLLDCAMNVAAGFGVTLIPTTMHDICPEYVCRKNTRKKDSATRYYAAWIEERKTPLMEELIEMIRAAYAEQNA